MILQASKTLDKSIRYLTISVHSQPLDFENIATLEDYNIFNKTTVLICLPLVIPVSKHFSLYSRCEDCWVDDCPFNDLFEKWKIHELSKKQGNAYLILCQQFGLPNDVINIIEDNHEDNGIRLGDALHRICHKNPNITREEVIEIISNGNT